MRGAWRKQSDWSAHVTHTSIRLVFSPQDQDCAIELWRALQSIGINADLSSPSQLNGKTEKGAPAFLLLIASPSSANSMDVSAVLDAFIKAEGRARLRIVYRAAPNEAQALSQDVVNAMALYERDPKSKLLQDASSELVIIGDLSTQSVEVIAQKLAASISTSPRPVDMASPSTAPKAHPSTAWWAAGIATATSLALSIGLLAAMGQMEALQQQAHDARQASPQLLARLDDELSYAARNEVFGLIGSELIDTFDLEHLRNDPGALAEQARLLHVVGTARRQNGDFEGAMEAYQLATLATSTWLEADPENEVAIFEHAQSVFWIGDLAFHAGRHETASNQFTEYAALAARLVEADANNMTYRAEWAYAQSNLGAVANGANEREQALEYFETAIDLYQDRLVEEGIVPVTSLANANGWAAILHRSLASIETAILFRSREAQIYRNTFTSTPHSRSARIGIVNAVQARASMWMDLGELDQAQSDLDEISDLIADLRQDFPDDRDARRHHLGLEMMRARLSLYAGNTIRAQLLASALERDNANATNIAFEDDRMVDQASFNLLKAEIALAAGAYEPALTLALQAAADFERDLDSEAARYAFFAAFANYYAGEAMMALGREGDAMRAWRRAHSQVLGLSAPRDLRADDVLSRVSYRLGDVSTAQSLRDQLSDAGYARPDHEAFWTSPPTPLNVTSIENEEVEDG